MSPLEELNEWIDDLQRPDGTGQEWRLGERLKYFANALEVQARELAEAHAALRDLSHELHDAALARNMDELWEWGRDSTQLDLLQRHGDAIRAAQEDKP